MRYFNPWPVMNTSTTGNSPTVDQGLNIQYITGYGFIAIRLTIFNTVAPGKLLAYLVPYVVKPWMADRNNDKAPCPDTTGDKVNRDEANQ